MPNYGKFLKELISNKHKIKQILAAFLSDESFAMIQNKVPPKLRDPKSFLILCNFKTFSCNALADIVASINLMPYSSYAKLSLETLKPTKMSVRFADRSFQYPVRVAENMLVEVGKFTFPADFVNLEMEEDRKVLLILGRPFLHTADAVIRVKRKQLNLGQNPPSHRRIPSRRRNIFEFDEFMEMTADENSESESDTNEPPFEKITINIDYKIKTSLEEPPTDLELKPLPNNLEYVFLEEPHFLHALKHMFKKQDAKPRLIQWILLLQEFDIEIKDRKGTENVATDHLSRIENKEISDDSEVDDNFLEETLMEINTKDEPWFTEFANYLEPYLFKVCSDGMIRRSVSGPETRTILDQCHHRPVARHYGPNVTAKKLLDLGFYWPTIIKEAHTLVCICEACQKTANISKRDEIPLNNIQVCEIFDVWDINFMGPFPKSQKFECILIAVDYVSKWAKAEALPTNDARVVLTFLKKLFCHFGMPKTLISNR
nr:reverse transcriptase domain-containing protein [Tanacetum cinerariifolium]